MTIPHPGVKGVRWGLYRVQGLGFRVLGFLGFRVLGSWGLGFRVWGFPKIKGTLLGVPIIRVIVFRGIYIGVPLFLGHHHISPVIECFLSGMFTVRGWGVEGVGGN